MKLTVQEIKKLIKEELRKLFESTGDPQVDSLISALNLDENIDISIDGNRIVADIRAEGYEDEMEGYIFETYIYSFNMKHGTMTQGMLYSNDYGVPHEIYFNDKGYISQQPKTVMEFLKLVSNKSGELK